jgi:hypothetical protein
VAAPQVRKVRYGGGSYQFKDELGRVIYVGSKYAICGVVGGLMKP